jgi:carbon-monoxide dehydrogenase medium subunit
MYSFNYHQATTLADATAKLAANPDAKMLAGGQTLIAAMKLRLASPSDLIDLKNIRELRGIKVESGSVTIGAMTTHAEVASSSEVRKAIPALSALAESIGDRMVRNMGTLGGSLANNDPAADYPAAILGLGATIVTNKRKIAADDFFKSMYETALQVGEIISAVTFPIPKRAGYAKFKNPASRYAIVGVMVSEGTGVRVAVTGAGPCVFRIAALEKMLSSKFSSDAVANYIASADGLSTDMHASAEYRAHLITVMTKRAVEQALKG